jgi:hypothetical protein
MACWGEKWRKDRGNLGGEAARKEIRADQQDQAIEPGPGPKGMAVWSPMLLLAALNS